MQIAPGGTAEGINSQVRSLLPSSTRQYSTSKVGPSLCCNNSSLRRRISIDSSSLNMGTITVTVALGLSGFQFPIDTTPLTGHLCNCDAKGEGRRKSRESLRQPSRRCQSHETAEGWD